MASRFAADGRREGSNPQGHCQAGLGIARMWPSMTDAPPWQEERVDAVAPPDRE
ncbi:hypothetical protein AB0H51_10995 [Streptomyces griseoluteus]|uniref:hypothetical protein n=1 Tax=Streptomyces griseoluteus TaxID=29306 RepID=UPI0033F8DB1A